MKKFVQSWLVNTLAVLVAVHIVPGIHFSKDGSFWTPFIVSFVLGILNTFIRPILEFFALPLLILTLGLFRLVINALLLYCVGLLLDRYFQVDNFWSAFLGALIISIITLVLHGITGTGNTRIRFEHRRRPPGSGDGGGPVIDV